jgi:hypothetical protein
VELGVDALKASERIGLLHGQVTHEDIEKG